MIIRKKSKEELQAQAEWFLNYVYKNWKISKITKDEILKVLWLNESEKKNFLERLSNKFWQKVNISNISQLKHLINKKKIDFWKLYEEYLIFLWGYLKARKKAKKFLNDFELSNYNNWLLNLVTHIFLNGSEETLKIITHLKYEKVKLPELRGWCKESYILEYIDKNPDGKNCAKIIFDKYPDVSEKEICDCFQKLTPKFFTLIIDKYPNLSKNEFELLLDRWLSPSDRDIKECILVFEKFPNISFRQFLSIFTSAIDYDQLKNLFKRYPNITVSEIKFLNSYINGIFRNLTINDFLALEKSIFIQIWKYHKDLSIEEIITLITIAETDESFENFYYKHKKDYKKWLDARLIYIQNYFVKYKNRIKNIKTTPNVSIEESFKDIGGSHFYLNKLDVLKFIYQKWWDDINTHRSFKSQSLETYYKDEKLSRWGVSYEFLKEMCERWPEISILQLVKLSSKENLKLIFEKYPEITIDELKSLENENTHILRWAQPKNLKLIFEKYPDIQINDLLLLKNENTHILRWAQPKNLKLIFEKYPEITIDELKSLENENTHILRWAQPKNLKLIFEKYPDIQINDLLLLENGILNWAQPENLEVIFDQYPDIQINDLLLLKNENTHILRWAQPKNLKKVLKNFWPLDFVEINQYKKLFCFNRQLPTTLNFKEENHKWYLNFLNEVLDTNYDSDKKSKMIAKVVTLTFEQAHNYVEVFKLLDDSISMDIQRVKNELIDELLETDNPKEDAQQIINIFERNNLPLTGKIFKVFELLYPRRKFKDTLQVHWSPVLHQYLDEWKNVYDLIYKDLMNIAIKSWDRSLRDYINTFVWAEKLLKKFEDIVSSEWFLWNEPLCLDKKLSEDEQAKLLYLFRRISVLYNRYYWKEINEWNTIEDKKYWESTVADNQLVEFYNDIKKWFHLRKWDSIYDRLQRFLLWLWYHSFDEVLKDMEKSKKGAHERWLKLYNESNWWKIDFPKHAFLKWVMEDAFSKIINRWVTSREYLWWWDDWNAAWSDCTPFDIDWWYADSFLEWGYGGIKLVVDIDKNNIFNTGEKWITWYDENQYELFRTRTLWSNHYWIRTWIPTTEIDYIIYTWNFEWKDFETICYEIARNGYYIPITDKEWNIKFTLEMYQKIRAWFNYMEYYDWFDVEQVNWKWVSKESDNKINKGYSGTNDKITEDWLRKLISDNSPSNEKYSGFSKENRELAENTIGRIKEILENQCWIKFNSKHDTSITWAELHDSWSTWRWTDIPTKDVDLDFTLLLDAKDYNEKLELIKETIYRETGTGTDPLDREWEWPRTWWFQMKSKKNKIGQGPERPDWISLDLLILKKSQVIDYSSSDAMKEKLNYINDNLWEEILDRVRTNVIIMKKLLKSQSCYKKTSAEWWIAWIWVENWITQHHWSFIEALESFEKVAYGWEYEPWKQPVSLEIFKEEYPIYDAWENYKDWCNDNFVDKINNHGYNWMLKIVTTLRTKWIEWIEDLIKEYEKKKKEYTG